MWNKNKIKVIELSLKEKKNYTYYAKVPIMFVKYLIFFKVDCFVSNKKRNGLD